MGRMFGGGDPDEPLALARLACAVGDDGPHAELCAAVLEQLDLYREHSRRRRPGRPIPVAGRFVVGALTSPARRTCRPRRPRRPASPAATPPDAEGPAEAGPSRTSPR